MSKKTIFVLFAFVLSICSCSLVVASDIPSLIKDLKDKDKAKDASYALAKIGKPAVPELIRALEGNNTSQKRYAARAIREMGQNGSDAIPALEKLLKDWDTGTREYVVEALGNMTQQVDQVMPILAKAREDSNKDVRKKAKSSIQKLKNKLTETERENQFAEQKKEDVKSRAEEMEEAKNYITQGYNYLNDKNYQEAKNVFMKSGKLIPSAEAFKGLGDACYGLGEIESATQYYEYATEKKTEKEKIEVKNNHIINKNIDLQTYAETAQKNKPKPNHSRNYLSWWNSTITIGQWETDPTMITIIVSIFMLVVIVAIAIKKTSDGVVIFFSSYFDLFLSFLPFIAFAISLIVVSSQSEQKSKEIPNWSIYTVIIVAVLYNYVKAYFDNRRTKFLAFCVGTGRITLGYLLPIIIILNLLEILSNRKEGESTGEFIFRKFLAGFMLCGTTVFLHNLIGSSRHSFAFDNEKEQRYDNAGYEGDSDYDESSYSYQKSSSTKTGTPFEILNISPNATKEEIKDAYRKLAQQYHPDKVAHLGAELQKVAHKKMKEINEAYEILINRAS